ncbi:uncharacterized protein [Haliotis cracherodii]|uniref:uncharacterized protein n=1 Tax=Haliotis cracherodii TaxID=6455 RepID=UPI0039E749A8
MSALTINRVTGDLKVIDWQKHRNKWNHLRGIRFPTIAKHPVVDLLIGIDYLQLHQSHQDVCGRPGEPIARRTPLGWTCIGNVGHDDGQPSYCALTYYTHSPNSELSDLVKSFWDVEEVKNTSQIIKPCDKRALCKAEESLVYHHGRYQVGIPWKEEAPSLPNNYDMAYRRLVSTEKKLSKDPTVAQDYDSTLSQYLEKGYINKVTVEHKSTDAWYLPHFPVMRPDKSTTKVRIVFDALAKYGNASLNDAIDPGPKLQTELFDVLLRFRKSPVAIICDIAEMFLQVEMDPRDRPFHRFLWRSMSPDVPPDVYEFNRLVFGNTASPFLAQFVSQENAKKHEAELPKAAETVMKSTYMDDSMDSVETDDDGVDLYCQLKQLWSKASMHPRKWLSNSLKVLAHIPQSDRASKIDIREGSLPSVKALGLMWVPEDDIFRCKAEPLPTAETTKRGFLRQVARLFDPHGFLGPFIVTSKILLQNLWLTGHDWDDNLPEHLQDKISEWLGQWKDIETLEIPRCLRTSSGVQTTCIHTFVDASEDAYGTSVFAVYTYQNGDRSSRLVAAKNRVSPLKACSIPRLELMAAVLGLRLVSGIVKVLQIEMDSVIFLSDSMNVLCWIRNNSRTFKPFVANRVGEIHSSTNPSQWRYVPLSQNPADLLTRGLPVSQLVGNQLWWSGPTFLLRDEEEWPLDKSLSFYEKDDQEKKSRKTIVVYTVMANADPEWRLEPTRFSCWKKLTRTCAWVNRFLYNCSNPADLRMIEELSREELNDAEIKLVAQAQQEAFPGEYSALSSGKPMPNSSKLQALHPQIDETGVMRLSGRLKDAECLPFAARFPIILPRRSWITKLVIKHAHEEGHHVSGTNRTLDVLSSKYWIVSAREAIREWEKECSTCHKSKAKPVQQVMAPLPKIRLQASFQAFSMTAVDYAGPFSTIQGRGKVRLKRYLCLFTCLGTRAVHLEMAYSLDTDAFLNEFFRMTNRRRLPTEVLSDNGTNFVGAVRELKDLLGKLDKDAIQKYTANRGIKWHFNPPSAPHFGGVFEILIKAAKKAIFAILSKSDVTDEELQTAFTGAEALINSRPLTYQTCHPQDDNPLTPNHFLHGQVGGVFAPESVDTTDYHPRKRWRRLQELMRHFWRRWMREWLPALNTRRKWNRPSKDVRVDDVVLVSPETPRGQWPLGIVERVYPGPDGHVRVVDVRVANSTLTRPVTKICPLEWTA